MIWQPIETAPKDGKPILAFWPSMDDWDGVTNEYECRTWWSGGAWHTPFEFSDQHQCPTHWMPLPEPPK